MQKEQLFLGKKEILSTRFLTGDSGEVSHHKTDLRIQARLDPSRPSFKITTCFSTTACEQVMRFNRDGLGVHQLDDCEREMKRAGFKHLF